MDGEKEYGSEDLREQRSDYIRADNTLYNAKEELKDLHNQLRWLVPVDGNGDALVRAGESVGKMLEGLEEVDGLLNNGQTALYDKVYGVGTDDANAIMSKVREFVEWFNELDEGGQKLTSAAFMEMILPDE